MFVVIVEFGMDSMRVLHCNSVPFSSCSGSNRRRQFKFAQQQRKLEGPKSLQLLKFLKPSLLISGVDRNFGFPMDKRSSRILSGVSSVETSR